MEVRWLEGHVRGLRWGKEMEGQVLENASWIGDGLVIDHQFGGELETGMTVSQPFQLSQQVLVRDI